MGAEVERVEVDQILFRVFAPEGGDRVSAIVFAQRLAAFVRALIEADKAENAKRVHSYTIAKLHTSTPTVILTEQPRAHQASYLAQSGISAVETCIEDLQQGRRPNERYRKLTERIEKLSRNERDFGFAEIWTSRRAPLRIDSFVHERAANWLGLSGSVPLVEAPMLMLEEPERWFTGTAIGHFDGTLSVADVRGATPRIKLTLTGGEREIECVCRPDDIANIGTNLKQRVRVLGRAIYDGGSGLPRIVEVMSIDAIGAGDFAKWKGAFTALPPTDYETDDI